MWLHHASTVPAHNFDFWVLGQPLLNALRLPISKQINNFVRLQVHHDTAKALAASLTPVIYPDDSHFAHLRQRNQEERAEHRGV